MPKSVTNEMPISFFSVNSFTFKNALRNFYRISLVPSRSMSCSSRSFQLQVNSLTGESEWIVVEEESNYDLEGSRLLAKTSYLDMLNDSRRNRAYRLAIEKTVTQPCHVLDIGAGTGLLSMMAARAMKDIRGDKKGKVSACESYLPMGKLMRKVLRANQMEKDVKVFHKRSDELKVGVDLDSHADVLVSEILDSELLGEGLIPTLQQAHDMLLTENPKTVPYRATIYGQLVESNYLWKLHDLHSQEVDRSDEIHLAPDGLSKVLCVKPKQYAMHCDALSKEIHLLSEPFKIFDFELWKRPDSYREIEMSIKATADGVGHAFISWWVLQLDSQGSVFYSTAPKWIRSSKEPGEGDWCDHWKQCVWLIPGSGISVSKDSDVLVKAVHDDISISYAIQNDAYGGFESENFHVFLSPERIGVYGDKVYRSALSTAVKSAVRRARSSPFCVVADDSVFLTLSVASFSKSSDILFLHPGLQEKSTIYLQAVANANGFSTDRVSVVGKKASCLLTDNSDKKMVDVLMGEPFYCGHEGTLPWQNLRFWKERTMLDPILAADVIIMPYKGILKACAMSLPDLWRSRCSLKKIEGFDHSLVNETLGACGELQSLDDGPCLPYFVWQCGEFTRLSEVFTVMHFNFSELIHTCHGRKKIEFTKSGLCHGFVLWIDWVLDDKESIVLSTGPDCRYWKQGVKLLSVPVEVNSESSTEIEANFDPVTGDLTVKSLFS